MKMYAIVTSEKASKGQGGNKRLDIQITVGSADNPVSAGVIAIREIEPNVFNIAYFKDGEGKQITQVIIDKIKGNKQKGEKASLIIMKDDGSLE